MMKLRIMRSRSLRQEQFGSLLTKPVSSIEAALARNANAPSGIRSWTTSQQLWETGTRNPELGKWKVSRYLFAQHLVHRMMHKGRPSHRHLVLYWTALRSSLHVLSHAYWNRNSEPRIIYDYGIEREVSFEAIIHQSRFGFDRTHSIRLSSLRHQMKYWII
jgi:hypothetical protein